MRLVEVKEGTTTIATFEHDGGGRRTEKVAAGLTHRTYDAEDFVEERISGSSSDTIRYCHGAGIDEPLARKKSSAVVTYYLADHLGSIAQETKCERVGDPESRVRRVGRTSAGCLVFRFRVYSSRVISWGVRNERMPRLSFPNNHSACAVDLGDGAIGRFGATE